MVFETIVSAIPPHGHIKLFNYLKMILQYFRKPRSVLATIFLPFRVLPFRSFPSGRFAYRYLAFCTEGFTTFHLSSRQDSSSLLHFYRYFRLMEMVSQPSGRPALSCDKLRPYWCMHHSSAAARTFLYSF